jgi:hypothetical protein
MIGEILAFKFPGKGSGPFDSNDYELRDYSDGRGVIVEKWDEAILGKRPTEAQITAWTAEYEAVAAARNTQRGKVESLLSSRGLTVKDLKDVLAAQNGDGEANVRRATQ